MFCILFVTVLGEKLIQIAIFQITRPTCLVVAARNRYGSDRVYIGYTTIMSTVANRAFPIIIVAARSWSDLPADVTSAKSLSTFHQRLKTYLFLESFPRYFLDF